VERQDVLKNLTKWLEAQEQLSLGIVFGSLITDRFNAASDVDLAVMGATPLSVNERVELAQSLGALINRNVDLIDLKSAQGLIVKQALTTGLRLKNTNPNSFAERLSKYYFNETYYGPLRDRAYRERCLHVFGI
jgi:uncharacterized protein